MDALLRLFFLTPVRCRSCRHRFYRFSKWWAKFVVPLGISVLLLLGAVELWPTWVARVWTRATAQHSVPVDSGTADRQLPFR